jgi:hypothetical protein
MTKIHSSNGHAINNVDWHPDVPFLKCPITLGEKIVDGTVYYICKDGVDRVKEVLDRLFKVEKTKIKNSRHKGETIGQDLYFTA